MKSFSKTLKDYKEKNGKTSMEMAALLGMSLRMYGYYEKGEYDGQPNRIQKYLDRLTGNLQQEKQVSGTPIYDLAATAGGVDYTSQLPEEPVFSVSVPGLQDCNFGMYVYGHSMYPVIESGSLVMCKKINDKSIIMYGEIYLIRTADYLMVKRLQKGEQPQSVLCTSDNFEKRAPEFKRFEPFEIERDKIRELYLVKVVIKKTQS